MGNSLSLEQDKSGGQFPGTKGGVHAFWKSGEGKGEGAPITVTL